MKRLRHRTHNKIGSGKSKSFALKQITQEYDRNYVANEFKVWEMLKNYKPQIIPIDIFKI